MADQSKTGSPPNFEPCRDCGAPISARAILCPKCGAPGAAFGDVDLTFLRDGVRLERSDIGNIILRIGLAGFILSLGMLLLIAAQSAGLADELFAQVGRFLLGVIAISLALMIFGAIPRRIEFKKTTRH